MFDLQKFLQTKFTFRKQGKHQSSRRPAQRLRLVAEVLEDRLAPAVALAYVNDNWNLIQDNGTVGVLDLGDVVRNNNDTINPGGITATYGMNAFGTVTTTSIMGGPTGSNALYDNINDAIANTNVGGTVNVLEGTYNELVSINKSVTVAGAQAGVDARTRSAVPESIVSNASGAFQITENNVTIDGFTIRDVSTGLGSGVHTNPAIAGYHILNNIITNNSIGIYANSNGAAEIRQNLITANNTDGPSGGTGIYSESTASLTIDNNELSNHTINSAVTFGALSTTSHTNLTFTNNFIHDNIGGIFALSISGGLFQGNTISNNTSGTALTFGGSNTGIDVLYNNLSGNARGLRIADFGYLGVTPNSDIEAHFNDFSGNSQYGAGISNEGMGLTDGYTGTLDLTCNWWGAVTGPTSADNPGGTGVTLRNDFADTIDFQPWLVYAPDSNAVTPGVQLATSFTVAAQTSGFTSTNNNYRRLVNAIECLQPGQTVTLSGIFDWTETNATVSWASGNDGVIGNSDDYTLTVRPNLNNVTITAATLGSATIQGPGDLANFNLERFLFFNGGDNQNWIISNLQIYDFDLSLYFNNGAGGSDAFNGTKILNNHIRVPADLNTTVSSVDVNQNIGIHYSFGQNQTIQDNIIDIVGSGLSDGANFSSSVGVQSNTSGGNVYDGLLIDGNDINVTGVQSAQPPRILGIWENGHAHTSDITISNNNFKNLTTGGSPATNLMRAFRVTSHSSATTTVAYIDNDVDGANIGFEWLASSNFTGLQPVQIIGSTLINVNTGVLVQSNGVALLSNNILDNSGVTGTGIGVDVLAGSVVTINDSVGENDIIGFATGIHVAGSSTIVNNMITGNTTGIDADGTSAKALIQGNDLTGNTTTGIVIRNGALVDAGDLSNSNTTGLGSSTGNNDLSGYSGVTLAINDQNLDANGDPDVKAQNNNFGTNLANLAELVIRHTVDDPALTLVVFTPLSTQPLPNTVYVDDNWAGTALGADPDGMGPATQFGVDAFATIQDGVNGVSTGGTVIVRAGTYTENVAIAKDVDLLGAQANVDARGRAGTLDPNVSSIITAMSGVLITLQTGSAGTIINGFTLSGGVQGITSTTGPINNLQVLNNQIVGFTGSGIFLNDSGVDNTISQNVIDGSSQTGNGDLLHLDTDNFDGFRLTNNNIVNSPNGTGFFVDGNHNVGVSATRSPLIQGNLFDKNATGANLGTRAFEFGTITQNIFSNNDFDGLQGGIQNSTISRNTFSNNGRSGLALTSFGNMGADRGAQNTLITENFFSNNTREDVFFSATQAPGTISTNTLTNNSLLSTVAVTYNGTETINASANWWGTNVETGVRAKISGTGAANVDSTPFLNTGVDTDPLTPGFQGNFSVLNVTAMGAQAGLIGRITEAAGLANVTGTVNVLAGSYTENVIVNKSVTLKGANAGISAGVGGFTRVAETIVTGGFDIRASNVVIDGFKVLNGLSGMGAATAAVLFATGTSGHVIQNNILQGAGMGAGIASAANGNNNNILIQDNDISLWPAAISNQGNTNVDILDNRIQNNTVGINNISANDIFIEGNSIVSNVEGIDLLNTTNLVANLNNIIGNTNAGLHNYGSDFVNAENNFWGSQSGPTVSSTPLADIVETVFGSVDYSPYLNHAALPFEDRFGEVGATSLSGAWQIRLGGFTIQGGTLKAAVLNSAPNLATLVNIPATDVSVSAQVDVSAADSSAALVARLSGANNQNMYWAGLTNRGGTVFAEIWVQVNGTWTLLDSQSGVSATGRLRFDVSGSSLQLYLNDVVVASTVNSALTTAGSTGVWLTNGATIDDFYVEVFSATLPFTDTFTQANGSPLSNFWNQVSGDFHVQNNILAASAATVNSAVLDGVSETNVSVEADVTINGNGSAALTLRNSGNDQTMYWGGLIHESTGSRVEIWKRVNGTWTRLTMVSLSGAPTAGELRFEALGSSLKLFLNNVLVSSTMDTSIQTAGTVGIWSTANSTFDNFHAELNQQLTAPLPFNDTFTQPNDSTLSDFWADIAGGFSVQNNVLVASATQVNSAILNGVSVANASAQANVTINGGGSAALTLRNSGNDQTMYWGGLINENGVTRAEIWRRVNGAWTLLTQTTVAGAPTSGLLRFVASGNTLTLLLNGRTVATTTDSAITTGGTIGIWSTASETFDNFMATTP